MEDKHLLSNTFFVQQLRKLLLRYMKEKQQTQAELCQSLGLGRWQLSRYQSNHYMQLPRRETLCRILEVTGTALHLTYQHHQPDGRLVARTSVMDLTDAQCPLPQWLHHRLQDYMEGRHPNPIHHSCSKKDLYQMLEINKRSFATFLGGHYTTDLSQLIRLFDLLQVIPSFQPRTPQPTALQTPQPSQPTTFLQPLPAAMVADDGE